MIKDDALFLQGRTGCAGLLSAGLVERDIASALQQFCMVHRRLTMANH